MLNYKNKQIMKITTITIALILVFSSCKLLQKRMLKAYGIKDPAIETEATIKETALKFGMDTSSIVTVNLTDFIATFKGAHGIPEGAVFNSKGEFIEYKDTSLACNAGLFDLIPKLSKTKNYNTKDKLSLKTELNKFRTIRGGKVATDLNPEYDFYLFIYWSVWTGKLNQNHVKVWEDLARKNTGAKIKVIQVNLDMQSYWPQEETAVIKDTLYKIIKKT